MTFAKPIRLIPDPRLVPLLEKYGITNAEFVKRGRLPPDRREIVMGARARIITEFHVAGTTWDRMMEITGLGRGGIQNYTNGTHNPKSSWNKIEAAVLANKGRKKPEVSQRNSEQWANGVRKPHYGHVRSQASIDKQKLGFTPDRLQKMSDQQKALWEEPGFRSKSTQSRNTAEYKTKMSETKVQWMREHPEHCNRSHGKWVEPTKSAELKCYMRSSFEVAAFEILERDPEVVSYEHEKTIQTSSGRWILPDFVVVYKDGHTMMVEVKPAFRVKDVPVNEEAIKRLKIAEYESSVRGWGFAIWTEKELEPWLTLYKSKKSKKPLETEPSGSVLSLLEEK